MNARYAAGTEVPADRSISEIRRTLRRYGATSFAFGEDEHGAVIGFAAHGRKVRFVLPMPDPHDEAFTLTPTRKRRTDTAAEALYEAAVRQVYRVFALVIKAKLEAVESGLVEFQAEFLAHLVLPGGQTVGDVVGGKVDEAYATGQVPELMPTYRRELDGGHR
jgi:hypothetical protein